MLGGEVHWVNPMEEDRCRGWPIRHHQGNRLIEQHRKVKKPASIGLYLAGPWLSIGSYAYRSGIPY